MDLTIVALYTICDDLLISIGHPEHPQAKMSDAEVMTACTCRCEIFRRESANRMRCLENAWIHSKYVGTLAIQSSSASDP